MTLLYVLVFVALVLFIYGVVESRRLTIKQYHISLGEVRSGNSICIAHLADSHGSIPFRLLNISRAICSVKPDLIVMTGDLVAEREDIEYACKALAELSLYSTVCFVPGNHDIAVGARGLGRHAVEQELSSRGVIVLRNGGTLIDTPNGAIWLGGVDDLFRGAPDASAAAPPPGTHVPRILLSHSPDIVLRLKPASWDLVLCGHTHGGQIRLPLIGPLVTNSRTGRLFWRGPTRFRQMTVFMSQGLGSTFLPVRFLCPPELSVLRIDLSQRRA